jgi:hypothetical protein
MKLFLIGACLTSLICLAFGGGKSTDSKEQTWVAHPGGEGPGAGKHIVLVSGDDEYRSEEALPQLAKILTRHHGFRTSVLFSLNDKDEIDPSAKGRIDQLALLDEADMMVIFTRFRRLPDEDMKHIVDFVNSGKPVLGIRTATHAFSYENDSQSPYGSWTWNHGQWKGGFGRQILGETWVNHHGHHGQESTAGVIPVAARAHPIVRGVEGVWGPTDVYGVRSLPEDAFVLLEGSVLAGMTPDAEPVNGPKNDPRMPVAWLRNRPMEDGGRQRIVCTTIGAATDFESEGLRRFFVNACYWGVGMEDRIPADSKVDIVGEYDPTDFGFGNYVKGVRPADHAGME